jgi:hypothetical protein
MEHSARRPRKLAIRAGRGILPVLAQTGGSSMQWQRYSKWERILLSRASLKLQCFLENDLRNQAKLGL